MDQSLNADAQLKHEQIPAEPSGLPESGERLNEPHVIEEAPNTDAQISNDTEVPAGTSEDEELELIASLETMDYYLKLLSKRQTINQALALEMHRDLPDATLLPVNYFTVEASRTNLELAQESLSGSIHRGIELLTRKSTDQFRGLKGMVRDMANNFNKRVSYFNKIKDHVKKLDALNEVTTNNKSITQALSINNQVFSGAELVEQIDILLDYCEGAVNRTSSKLALVSNILDEKKPDIETFLNVMLAQPEASAYGAKNKWHAEGLNSRDEFKYRSPALLGGLQLEYHTGIRTKSGKEKLNIGSYRVINVAKKTKVSGELSAPTESIFKEHIIKMADRLEKLLKDLTASRHTVNKEFTRTKMDNKAAVKLLTLKLEQYKLYGALSFNNVSVFKQELSLCFAALSKVILAYGSLIELALRGQTTQPSMESIQDAHAQLTQEDDAEQAKLDEENDAFIAEIDYTSPEPEEPLLPETNEAGGDVEIIKTDGRIGSL